MWYQKNIKFNTKKRGFHLITLDILKKCYELNDIKIGILNLFIQHTSASLTINENNDRSVKNDLENYFNYIVKENKSYYQHNDEGIDDMPAHIKNSLLGNHLSIPIKNGFLNMGIWQGIYLCEHRNQGSERNIIITMQGQI